MLYYYIDAVNGTDDEANGKSKEKAYKTLEYCITELSRLGLVSKNDVTVYLSKGEYALTTSNIFFFDGTKTLSIVGLGFETVINNSFSGNNGVFGTVGFNVEFKTLIWDNKGIQGETSNNFLFNNNMYMYNVLFRNINEDIYGWWGGTVGHWKLINCIVANYIKYFLREDPAGDAVIEGCYGYITHSDYVSNIENIIKSNNKIITDRGTPLQLGREYLITDPSVDTSKIGLYAGDYTWGYKCLIKMGGQYYSILPQFWNELNSNFNPLGSKNFDHSFLLAQLTNESNYGSTKLTPIDKFDNFNIIFKDQNVKSLKINGYKILEKTVKIELDVRNVENFTYIKIKGVNSKFLFNFDKEKVWYKYNELNSELEEVLLENIKNDGMELSKSQDIDFNKIKENKNFKKINFSLYLQTDSFIEDIELKYIEVGEFSLKDSTTTNLQVGFKKLKITPYFSAPLVKINVI